MAKNPQSGPDHVPRPLILQTSVPPMDRLAATDVCSIDLKSTLGLRPVRHRLDWRISGHPLSAVLACHAMHLSWASIRNRRANCVHITTSLQEVCGSQICIPQDARPDAAAFELRDLAGHWGAASPPSAPDTLEGRPKCAKFAKCRSNCADSVKQTVSYQELTGTLGRQMTNLGQDPSPASSGPMLEGSQGGIQYAQLP